MLTGFLSFIAGLAWGTAAGFLSIYVYENYKVPFWLVFPVSFVVALVMSVASSKLIVQVLG